jgi:hypothetical protein
VVVTGRELPLVRRARAVLACTPLLRFGERVRTARCVTDLDSSLKTVGRVVSNAVANDRFAELRAS